MAFSLDTVKIYLCFLVMKLKMKYNFLISNMLKKYYSDYYHEDFFK